MKLLTVAIPCYNSAEYMHNAIESCLVGGDDVEIIIVDDGSQKDNTLEIGKKFEAEYPGIIKCIHQENGGHGGAVNTGLANATGVYFKVLDSDDWLAKDSLLKALETLKKLHSENNDTDMFLANYVYEKVCENKTKPIKYTHVFPENKMFSWDEVGKFLPHQNILMHCVIYRTQLLRDCKLELPKHTFYVDNLFVYLPLPYVHKMYYMNLDLYRYFIGRDDQSVNEKVMISRLDQQLRVNKIMMERCKLAHVKNKKCREYMIHYLSIITMVSSVLLYKSGKEENFRLKRELWDYLEKTDEHMYKEVRRTLVGMCMQLDGKIGRWIVVHGYAIARKIFPFN